MGCRRQKRTRKEQCRSKAENLREKEWLDDACEPAHTFTYGTTIGETLTWGIAQRMVVQRLLEQLGLQPDQVEA